MTTTAQGLLDQTNAAIISLQDRVSDSLNNLSNVASQPYLSWFDFAATSSFTPSAPGNIALKSFNPLKVADVTGLTPPSAPTFNAADLPTLQKALLDALPQFSLSVDTTALKAYSAQCQALVESGGVDISPAVQQAVFDTGYERDLQVLRDELDLTGARTGAKGFRYPNSMTKAAQETVLQKYRFQRFDQSREITKAFADMAQKNIEAGLRLGIQTEQAVVDVAIRIALATLESQRLLIDKYRTEQQAYLEEFEGTIKGIMAGYDVQKLSFSTYLEYLQSVREQLSIEQSAYTTQFEGDLKSAMAQLDADKSNAELQVRVQNLFLEAYRTMTNTAVEKGKAEIEQAEQANALKLKAIEGLAQSYVGLLQNMSVDAVSLVKG